VQLKVTGFWVKEAIEKANVAECPAVTGFPPLVTVSATAGPIWVRSVPVSSPAMTSPPPETVTLLVTELGAFAATLTVKGGATWKTQLMVREV
jgi:hypothetical protein